VSGSRLSPERREGRSAGSYLIERETALPRAYVLHRVIHEPDPERALAVLTDSQFDPHRVAVVDRQVTGLSPRSHGEPESATITAYGQTEVALTATCSTACLLVLTDLLYPGWVATVDGRPTEMYRANVLFRAVRLDPGVHRVVFRYRSRSVQVGLLTSLATVGFLLIGGIWMRRSEYR
jgi:hypothetical protein